MVVRLAHRRAGPLERTPPPPLAALYRSCDIGIGCAVGAVGTFLSNCAVSIVLSIHTLAMWFLTGNMLQKHRMRLGPDVYGRRHGITLMQAFAQSWMPLLPPLLAGLIGRGLTLGWPSYILPIVRWVPPMQPRSPSPLLGLAAGYGSLALSVLLAVTLIPAYVRPFNPSMPCVGPHDPCGLGQQTVHAFLATPAHPG